MISSDSTRDWPLQTSRALPMASDWVAVLLDQHAIDVPLFPRVLPSLQPVANAISRTDECNLIDQSIRHSGYRLRLTAGKESILDSNCRRLVPHALCSIIVEILV